MHVKGFKTDQLMNLLVISLLITLYKYYLCLFQVLFFVRHQQILADGARAGFFIGDGAGVGKGRQIAGDCFQFFCNYNLGIIFDSYARGRTKHVWFRFLMMKMKP